MKKKNDCSNTKVRLGRSQMTYLILISARVSSGLRDPVTSNYNSIARATNVISPFSSKIELLKQIALVDL